MIVGTAVFVINDQQQRVIPQRALPDMVVNIRNKIFARDHVVIGMLVGGKQIVMIGIVGLDETVIRQVAGGGVGQKIFVGSHGLRLVLQHEGEAYAGTLLVEVINLRTAACIEQA